MSNKINPIMMIPITIPRMIYNGSTASGHTVWRENNRNNKLNTMGLLLQDTLYGEKTTRMPFISEIDVKRLYCFRAKYEENNRKLQLKLNKNFQ